MAGEDGGLFDLATDFTSTPVPDMPSFQMPQLPQMPDFSAGVPSFGVMDTIGPPGQPSNAGDPTKTGMERLSEGFMNEVTGSPLKALSTGLGLGALGLNFANQGRVASQLSDQTNQLRKSQAAATAAAAPAVSAGTADINRAQQGQLQPAMEATIQEWVQRAKADMRARFASMGLGNSTDIEGEDKKIDLMAQSMRGQLLQGEEAVGQQGVQVGVQAAGGVADTASRQQALLTQLIGAANQQLGQLGGRTA